MSKPWTANELFSTVNKALADYDQDSLNDTLTSEKIDNSNLITAIDERVQGNVLEMAEMIKSHFLNNLNHEVRTPLNTIVGFTRLLKDDCTKHEHFEYLQNINRSTNDLLFLFDELLELTQNEASSYTVDMTRLNLNEFLSSLKLKYECQAKAKGLNFVFLMPEALPQFIYADKGKMYIILKNLLENAIKFTEQGSVVFSLTMRNHKCGESVDLSFRVNDTGIGLPKDHEGKLFVPFANFSNRDYNEKGGVGIGLSIVKSYVNKLGGSINFKSGSGGTVFLVDLPAVALSLKENVETKVNCPSNLEALLDGEFLNSLKADPEYKAEFITLKNECLSYLESLIDDLLVNDIQLLLALLESFLQKRPIESLKIWHRGSKAALREYNMETLAESIKSLHSILRVFPL